MSSKRSTVMLLALALALFTLAPQIHANPMSAPQAVTLTQSTLSATLAASSSTNHSMLLPDPGSLLPGGTVPESGTLAAMILLLASLVVLRKHLDPYLGQR